MLFRSIGKNTYTGFNGRYRQNQVSMRNKRSVWTVSTKPYPGPHYATFPPDLILPCILAGCPVGGIVLDPFVGSGTTVMVARQTGRKGIGLDLSFSDLRNLARARIEGKTLPKEDEPMDLFELLQPVDIGG